MSKLVAATALVILGLEIGLWIGFNPEAHAAAQEKMDGASQAFAQSADAGTWLGGVASPEAPTPSSETAAEQQTATDNSSEGLDLQEI